MIINIEHQKNIGKFAFLHLGFRPFFIGAGVFGFLALLIWSGIYVLGWKTPFMPTSAMTWHAHEMIFGYCLAVIAGFLLTAIKNWTHRQTLHGYPLLLLFLVWIAARLLFFFGALLAAAIIDNVFILLLCIAMLIPLLQAKHWKSVALVSLVLLLLFSNIIFYLGVFGILPNGIHNGLYSGLYLIIAVIFIMGRRVIPFFIEKGVDGPVHLKNWSWIDNSHLLIFLIFWISDMIAPYSNITAACAGILGLIHGIRLLGWYTPEIWKKPLLWVLYVGYLCIVVGFFLKVAAIVYGLSVFLAVHAFALGGIGMITIGMMARVSLGHTGRNVFSPPPSVFWIFALLLVATVLRVILPLVASSYYIVWIALSQLCWIVAFAWFLYLYVPMLIFPRVDGRYG